MFGFYIFPQPHWVFYIYNFLHIHGYIHYLCFERAKVVRCNFLLEVINVILTNQLMLSLICHLNYKIRNERQKTIFSKLRNLWKRFFWNCFNITIKVQNASWIFLSQVGYLVRVKGLNWFTKSSKFEEGFNDNELLRSLSISLHCVILPSVLVQQSRKFLLLDNELKEKLCWNTLSNTRIHHSFQDTRNLDN